MADGAARVLYEVTLAEIGRVDSKCCYAYGEWLREEREDKLYRIAR